MTWREYVLQVMAHRRRVRTLGRYCLKPWAAGRVQRTFFKFEGVPLFPSEHAEIGKPVLMEPVEPQR